MFPMNNTTTTTTNVYHGLFYPEFIDLCNSMEETFSVTAASTDQSSNASTHDIEDDMSTDDELACFLQSVDWDCEVPPLDAADDSSVPGVEQLLTDMMIDVAPQPAPLFANESVPLSLKPYDVIWGRSTSQTESHPGNQRFRELIDRHRGEYQASSLRRVKGKVVNDIMREIASWSPGGRFLKPIQRNGDIQDWCLVGIEDAEEKVRKALRRAE